MAARRWRLAVFVLITAFMLAGPVTEQLFGLRTAFWRSWTMFSGIGIGLIDVSFASRNPDGTLTPIDRFRLLGAKRGGKLRRIESSDELAAVTQRLCTALGPGADLRVTARQATSTGWQVLRTEAQNACAS
jgi:hypothetical protein